MEGTERKQQNTGTSNCADRVLGEIESMNYGTVAPPTIEQEQKSVNEVMRVLVITLYQVDPEVLN